MEKPGVEPGTFSTQLVRGDCTVLRRCHTARPYPLTKLIEFDVACGGAEHYINRW